MNKVIRDGKVAVLVSPGFGAGWSTWAEEKYKEWAMFAPEVVEWVENGKTGSIDELVFAGLGKDAYLYTGGARDLTILWVPVGSLFRIDEYDGSESLVMNYDVSWNTA